MTDVKMKLHLCKEPDKFKFTELNQKSSKELFFLFYNSIIMV